MTLNLSLIGMRMSKKKSLIILITLVVFLFNINNKTRTQNKKVVLKNIIKVKNNFTKKITKRTKRQKQKIKARTIASIKKSDYKEILKTYDYMSQFPKTSSPLRNITKTKIERKYIIKKRLTTAIDTPTLQARSWSTQNYYYIPGRIPTVKIQVLHKNKRIKAKIKAKLYDSKNVLIREIQFKPNRSLTYEKSFKGLEEGHYLIKYIASISSSKFIKSIESFSISKNNISYLDQMKDYLDNEGNLVIETLIDSKHAGQYLLQSVCYDEDNNAIALAEKFHKITKGKQWIKYTFHGYIFTSLGQKGSFNIKHLSMGLVTDDLSIDTGKPYHKNYWTNYYRSSEFNHTAFSNSEYLNKKNRLLSYLKR